MKIQLTAESFKVAASAVMLAASKDAWRPHMASVRFVVFVGALVGDTSGTRRGKLCMSATNGHWAVRHTLDCDVTDWRGATNMVVPCETLRRVVGSCRNEPNVSIGFRHKRIRVGSTRVQVVDPSQPFPALDTVLTDHAAKESKMRWVCVRHEYVTLAAKVIKMIGGDKANMVLRTNADHLSGVRISSESIPGLEILIMPTIPADMAAIEATK